MANNTIEAGRFARHKRTGGIYSILFVGLLKTGDQDTWLDSVVYQSADGRVFTRDKANFDKNFEPHTPPSPIELDIMERAKALQTYANARGYFVEIEALPYKPLSMGHYMPHIRLRETFKARKAREEAEKRAKELKA